MSKQFQIDLQKARVVEELVADVLTSVASGWTFELVGDQPQYFHKGDIIATAANGEKHFIEVKNDSCIAESGNVLCEEENYFKSGGYYSKGNIYSDYEIYCVVSQQERKMYFIDFKVMQQIYKRCGDYCYKNHWEQISYFYLLPLHRIKQFGGLIKVLNY